MEITGASYCAMLAGGGTAGPAGLEGAGDAARTGCGVVGLVAAGAGAAAAGGGAVPLRKMPLSFHALPAATMACIMSCTSFSVPVNPARGSPRSMLSMRSTVQPE